jgi:DNA-binding transcriptional ArsR family regulator
VAPVAKAKEPGAFGISARTAKALADPWRIRVLAAVSVRPLSPSRFVEEVGGELTHVSRCFRQLAEWGYIEVVEERPGRRRGVAIEHVYRAIRRAHFDTCSWKSVPRSKRDAVSRSVISSYQERIREAIEAGTFDQEIDRHLSWDAVALDGTAWGDLAERLDLILDSLSEHEFESAKRLAGTNGEQIPTTIGLAAFRSPGLPSLMLRGARRHLGPADPTEPGALYAIGPKLAKALSNPWRCKILAAVSVRPLSPSQFVEEVGGSITHISRCFRELAKWGYLEVLEERRGGRHGGGVERIYRSTHRPYFDTATWKALPQIVRDEISQFFLDTYFERVAEAIEAGTFDADINRHLSWKPVVIDRSAWTQIGESLDEVLAWLPELEAQSAERAQDVETLVPTTVGLAAFRSPSRSI